MGQPVERWCLKSLNFRFLVAGTRWRLLISHTTISNTTNFWRVNKDGRNSWTTAINSHRLPKISATLIRLPLQGHREEPLSERLLDRWILTIRNLYFKQRLSRMQLSSCTVHQLFRFLWNKLYILLCVRPDIVLMESTLQFISLITSTAP